jgi:toxin ParE1/3/4
MRPTRFNRLAERELSEAIQYYDQQSAGLGQRFLDEVEHALVFIRRHPEAAPRILGSIRRLVLPSFPYNLLYRPLKGGGLRILAVAHQKRHPWYWVGRA